MRLIAPLLAIPAACLVLASPAAAGTDLPRYTPGYPGHVGVSAKYDSIERETNRTESQDPRNRHTRVADKTEATGQAQTSQNHPASPCAASTASRTPTSVTSTAAPSASAPCSSADRQPSVDAPSRARRRRALDRSDQAREQGFLPAQGWARGESRAGPCVGGPELHRFVSIGTGPRSVVIGRLRPGGVRS